MNGADKKSECKCCKSTQAVFDDLSIAIERLEPYDNDEFSRTLLNIRSGVSKAHRRWEVTARHYCPKALAGGGEK